ncbi:MAG: excinuclease ABC subunit UvrA [Candidatus Riflebacteria bacterium]|nr:excinuclease ABC subunit UvrA [Candidatus Riflebacteria bacterium]
MSKPSINPSFLEVFGVSEHYLQDFDCKIPHNALTVVSGVSGSGKSSLVFDTICREGQRRFLETLSLYARGFLGRIKKPACRSIKGLRPAMGVSQGGQQTQIRSTVGTVTDLYDFLRTLFAHLGISHCPKCKEVYQSQSPSQLSDRLLQISANRPLTLFSPIVQGHRGSYRQELENLKKKGYKKIRIDGTIHLLDSLPAIPPKEIHFIEVLVVEALLPSTKNFEEYVEKALVIGKQVLFYDFGTGDLKRATTQFACPTCGESPPEVGPRLFSFNSPFGACQICQGLGVEDAIDPALLIGDPALTLREGALVLTTPKGYIIYSQVTMDVLNQVCQAHGFSVDIPWEKLSEEQRHIVLYGSDKIKIPFGKHPLESRLKWSGITARPREEDYYKGIIPSMDAILKRDRNPNIMRFVRSVKCSSCQGKRLNSHALAVTFQGCSIDQLSVMSIDQLSLWLQNLSLKGKDELLSKPILDEMQIRMKCLSSLGLGHLSIDRPSPSLASGEWRRISLALQTFTELSGMLYVLDEPSLGLHTRDQEQLLDLLLRLRDYGNTVLAVDHRRDMLLASDWMLDLGPGAGPNGGRLLFEGTVSDFMKAEVGEDSPTRKWLREPGLELRDAVDFFPSKDHCIRIVGASQYNLKNIDVSFPLRALTAVTGVSGAGKTTLVETILSRHLRRELNGASDIPGAFCEIHGVGNIEKIIVVDQRPIGRTPRSNPATYTGLFDLIRDIFAKQPLAKENGWNKSRFSWNVPGGRCEACQGAGIQEIGLHLLDPVEIKCEDCGGKRYLPETLEVKYRNHSISQILDLTVTGAFTLFSDQASIARILQTLQEVGLGYLTLGQSSTTLSGGEAQRVKLATELSKSGTRKALYILNEPATGLHHTDILLPVRILRPISWMNRLSVFIHVTPCV